MPTANDVNPPRSDLGQYSEYLHTFPEVALDLEPAGHSDGPATVTLSDLVEMNPDFWAKLSEDEDTPLNILAFLSRSGDPSMRVRIACNDGIDEATHERLSVDADGAVRAGTIVNYRADAAFLARFDDDMDPDVLSSLSSNKHTSAVKLLALYGDGSENLYDLAVNRSSPEELLAKISVHLNAAVRSQVLHNSAVGAGLVNGMSADVDDEVRALVAGHRLATIDTLRSFIRDPSPHVRLQLARNPGIDRGIAEALVNDENPLVRSAIARLFARS